MVLVERRLFASCETGMWWANHAKARSRPIILSRDPHVKDASFLTSTDYLENQSFHNNYLVVSLDFSADFQYS